MKAILILAHMVVLYEGVLCEGILSDFVLVNQPYTFPRNASACDRAEWRKIHPTGTTITTYNNHVCTTARGLEEELRCKDDRLLLESAKYTDQGSYEFICDGVQTYSLHLDVSYAVNVSAAVTDSITLNCYAHTTKDVKWLHDRKTVLHYKIDGSLTYGEQYKGRVSLEKNCFKTGDFSLTIARVHETDAGAYHCFVDDETVKGTPQASVLHVNTPHAHSNCNNTLTVLTVVFGLISVISVTYVIYAKLCICQFMFTPASQSSEDDTHDHDLMPPNSPATPVRERHSYPVQESKPSNTMPILQSGKIQ